MAKVDHFYDTSGWVYRHTRMFNLRHDLTAPIIDAPIEIEPVFPSVFPPLAPVASEREPLGDIAAPAQNNQRVHKCAWTACTASFPSDFDLWVHTKAHWPAYPYPSPDKRICKWEACWLVHEGKKNYHSHCSKYLCIKPCEKLIASKKEGEDHMMLHTETRTFMFGCQVGRCVMRFRTVGALGRHVLTEHGRPAPAAAGESDKEIGYARPPGDSAKEN